MLIASPTRIVQQVEFVRKQPVTLLARVTLIAVETSAEIGQNVKFTQVKK